MKSETIKAIFTNVLFVIGVLLLVFGFVSGVTTVTKSILFDQYPLYSYDETRCETEKSFVNPPTYGPNGEVIPAETPEQKEEKYQTCLKGLERERKIKQTEDIVKSVSTLVSGGVLVYVFRRFIFH